MAAADFDLKDVVRQTRSQTSGRVEYVVRVDFSEVNDGAGLAAGESVDVFDLPDGYVHDLLVPICRTPQGAASTMDIGDEDDADGFGDGVSMNAAANSRADIAFTEEYLNGEYFQGGTTVRCTTPGGAATVDTAVYDFVFSGFLIA